MFRNPFLAILWIVCCFFLFGAYQTDAKAKTTSKKSLKTKKSASVKAVKTSNKPITYKVQKGDTLYGIAKKFGVSVEELKKLNQLKTPQLKPGQTIKIVSTKTNSEAKTSTSSKNNLVQTSLPESPSVYVVKKGDTLFSIAKKFGISVEDLKRINQLSGNSLRVGQTLIVKIPSNKPAEFSEQKPVESSQQEALQKVDLQPHKLNLQTPQTISSSKADSPKVISTEVVSGTPKMVEQKEKIQWITYKVKRGDTLYSIAKKFGVSVEELKRINHLNHTKLSVGKVIKVKEKRVLVQEKVNLPKIEAPSGVGFIWHKVKEGETLYNISLRYGIPIEDIKKLNNLEDNVIFVGQALRIPTYDDQPFMLENPAVAFQEKTRTHSFSDFFLNRSFLDLEDEKRLQDKFIEIAKQYEDYRYKLGGNGNGYMDCSMFVKKVFESLGIDLPRTSREQFWIGVSVSKDELIPGDLLFFAKNRRPESINHVGIYIGNNRFMHFSSTKRGLAVDSLDSNYFKTRFVGAKRVLKNSVLFNLSTFSEDVGS
ncbi:LysM peptidoglycan-binding domain-containing protein [Thermodesulfobacterium hveragerdense]|uniref:C40 family peptidase n=1 Tax=Thermodesulfobacterium hveragerdense TaxID=53424 RepID=UPI0003FE77A3|nr:LysM peptidoglycan-binding domain-containing protein [Thermodesulfobacterium hveragerdense]